MALKLLARIENYGNAGYLAYIESIKGMSESGVTAEEAMKELIISLKVKIAFDLGIEFDGLKETVISQDEYKIEHVNLISDEGVVEKEINLTVC